MKRRYITAILAMIVLCMQPEGSGKRKIGKEITTMKPFKKTESEVIFRI